MKRIMCWVIVPALALPLVSCQSKRKSKRTTKRSVVEDKEVVKKQPEGKDRVDFNPKIITKKPEKAKPTNPSEPGSSCGGASSCNPENGNVSRGDRDDESGNVGDERDDSESEEESENESDRETEDGEEEEGSQDEEEEEESEEPTLGEGPFSFNHDKGVYAMNDLLSWIVAIESDMRTNVDPIRVCVETGFQHFSEEQILFETKLAFAMWLNAAKFSEHVWEKIRWETSETCADVRYPSRIVLGGLDEYDPFRVKCQRNVGCQFGGTNLGVSYSAILSDLNAEELYVSRGARISLTPYAELLPMLHDIENTSSLAETESDALLGSYKKLAEKVAEISLAELVDFIGELRDSGVEGVRDPVAIGTRNGFVNGNADTLDTTYRPIMSMFPILLHEIGHQLGLGHSDSRAGAVDVNGGGDSDNRTVMFSTSRDRALVLTKHDIAGIRSLRQEVEGFITRLQGATNAESTNGPTCIDGTCSGF